MMYNFFKRIGTFLNNSKAVLTGTALLLFFFSCIDHRIVFHNSIAVNPEAFKATDTLTWKLNQSRSFAPGHHYALAVETRNLVNYPYANLGLVVQVGNDSISLMKDTVELTLINKHGQWQGEGWGSLYTQRHPIETLYFPMIDSLEVKIYPLMTDRNIKGLVSIGLLLEHPEH